MPYSKLLNKAVICPPKCGTTTIQWIFGELTEDVTEHDHRTFRQMAQHVEPGTEWAMAVREPMERFVSAVNSYAGWSGERGLEATMDHALQRLSIVFEPQVTFLEGGRDKVKLFSFDELDKLAEWLGYMEQVPRINESRTNFSASQIRDHPLFEKVWPRYARDLELWDMVND